MFDMRWMLLALAFVTGQQTDTPQALVTRLWQQYSSKVVQRDVDAVADFYTADARLMEAGADDVLGRIAIRALLKGSFAERTRILDSHVTPREVIAYDGIMFDSGDYIQTAGALSEPRHAVDRYGRYFAVWSQQPDGGWKIARLFAAPKKQPAGRN